MLQILRIEFAGFSEYIIIRSDRVSTGTPTRTGRRFVIWDTVSKIDLSTLNRLKLNILDMLDSEDITEDVTDDTPVASVSDGDEDQILFLDGSQRRGDFSFNKKALRKSQKKPRASIVRFITSFFR